MLSVTLLSAGLFAAACEDDSPGGRAGTGGNGAAASAGETGKSEGGDGARSPAGAGGKASAGEGEMPAVAGESPTAGTPGISTEGGAAGAAADGAAGDGGAGWEIPSEPPSLGFSDSAPLPMGVEAYVFSGNTNQRGDACVATLETNAGVRVVSGFLKIWAPRPAADGKVYVDAGQVAAAQGSCLAVTASDWSGIPLEASDGKVLLPAVHAANLAYVVQATQNRTPEQELAAYLDDRRGKNFSISDGMGPLTAAWRAGSKQTTTITAIPADATTVKYDDQGNNRGEDSKLRDPLV